MAPQRQEPVVPLMLDTPPASRPRLWLNTSVFGDGSIGASLYRETRLWLVRGPPIGRPLTHCQGSGGQVRAPCHIAVLGADDFETGVTISLPSDPQLGRSDGFR